MVGLALATRVPSQNVSLRQAGGTYHAVGWTAGSQEPPGGWPSVFAVYAGEGDVPPMLGSYSVEGGVLVFRPKYSVAPGVRVRAVFHPPAGPAVQTSFEPQRTTVVAATTYVER